MNRTAWKSSLGSWNEDLFTVTDMRPLSMLDKPVTDDWFGFPPASAEQVGGKRPKSGWDAHCRRRFVSFSWPVTAGSGRAARRRGARHR